MKYKLQLILTAFGILLTTVCHAQNQNITAIRSQINNRRDSVVVEISDGTHTLIVACSIGETDCIMPLAGTKGYIVAVADPTAKYPGTNVIVKWSGASWYAVYQLQRSY